MKERSSISTVFWAFLFSTPHWNLSYSPRPQTCSASLVNFPQCPFLSYYATFLLYSIVIVVPNVCHMPCLMVCLALIMVWHLNIPCNSVWQRWYVNHLMSEWGTNNFQVPWNQTEWTAVHHRWYLSLLFTYNCSCLYSCHPKQFSYLYWKGKYIESWEDSSLVKALVMQAWGPDSKSPELP